MSEVYFPWPITVEMFMSDFRRFFYFRNCIGKIKNVKKRKKRDTNKKRKKTFFTSMVLTSIIYIDGRPTTVV